MEPMVNITGSDPDNFSAGNGTEVLAHNPTTGETMRMRIRIELLPPACSFIEQLRQEFAMIELYFSGKPMAVMQCLLAEPEGQASRAKLMKEVWGKAVPRFSAIRQVVRRLNADLKDRSFGYVVRGSRKGIYRIVPFEK